MSLAPLAPARDSVHGKGRAELHVFGDNVHFAELSYTYPLKLLSPRQTTAAQSKAAQRCAILYSITYGGGLISGDRVELTLDVQEGAKLVLLTQGSTKVFPSRQAQRLSSGQAGGQLHTLQRMSARVMNNAFLVLLPDPVTPFKGASYSQTQIFRLASTAGENAGGSLLLLDWFTSGRIARGEEWEFDQYRSANEVWIGDSQVACDVLLLDQPKPSTSRLDNSERPLTESLAPYSCYATVLMFGPMIQVVSRHLRDQYDNVRQLQRKSPEPLIWSFSPLGDNGGCIIRVASSDTESVRKWLREALRGLESQIGADTYSRAFV